MAPPRFTRQELYDLVWTSPLLSLSKIYQISDVGLRKICVRMSIPLPTNGYWMRLKFGKQGERQQLDSTYKGDKSIELKLREEHTPPGKGVPSDLKILQAEIEATLKQTLIVPAQLKDPDILIIAAKNCLESKKPNNYTYEGTVCPRASEGVLDIRVAPVNLRRTLLILDTLIKALRARTHTVYVRQGVSYISIKKVELNFTFREKMSQEVKKEGSWSTTLYKPTGILTLNSFKSWKDGSTLLEDQISRIIAQMELHAKAAIQRNIEWEIRRAEWKEEQRKEENLLQLKKQELLNFTDTLTKATRWHKSTNLRNYIDAVEQKALAGSNTLAPELSEWLTWARKKADWYDPFIESDDELLADVHRDTLTSLK